MSPLDHFRRRQAGPTLEPVDWTGQEPPSHEPSVVERLASDADSAHLRQALQDLPADKRELIVLARYQRMPYEQLADLLDIEVGTLKVRVHRALKQLRERFAQLTTGRESCDVKMPLSKSDRC